MTPFDQILDAVAEACKAVPELQERAYIERQTKLDADRMPGVIVWPGSLLPGRLGNDANAMRYSFRVDLFCAGERPSRQFYSLAAAVHTALLGSVCLQALITELPVPAMDEPVYGDFDGFAGYLPIRYTVTVVTDNHDVSRLT